MNPGSDEAVLHGCLCDRAMNNFGGGYNRDPRLFAIARHCPLHAIGDAIELPSETPAPNPTTTE